VPCLRYPYLVSLPNSLFVTLGLGYWYLGFWYRDLDFKTRPHFSGIVPGLGEWVLRWRMDFLQVWAAARKHYYLGIHEFRWINFMVLVTSNSILVFSLLFYVFLFCSVYLCSSCIVRGHEMQTQPESFIIRYCQFQSGLSNCTRSLDLSTFRPRVHYWVLGIGWAGPRTLKPILGTYRLLSDPQRLVWSHIDNTYQEALLCLFSVSTRSVVRDSWFHTATSLPGLWYWSFAFKLVIVFPQ